MSRRAAKRPPKLDTPAPAAASRPRRERVLTPRARLVRARVTGRHDRFGRAEILAVFRRVVGGDPVARLAVPGLDGCDLTRLHDAARSGWGWDSHGPDATVVIDPDLTIAGFRAAMARITDVSSRGGRIAFATSRPASLLPTYHLLARLASDGGATVLDDDESDRVRLESRAEGRLWWHDRVAVLTDRDALLGDPGLGAVEELLFRLPRPDLVVADRAYAGGALGAGIEVVALADLDAVALGVAAASGAPVTLVPLQERRPPAAYQALADLAADLASGAGSAPRPAP